MKFDLKTFTKENLINGIKNGVFAKEQANIWAINYFTKGILGEEDIAQIKQDISEWETLQNVQEVDKIEEPREGVIDEEEANEEEPTDQGEEIPII